MSKLVLVTGATGTVGRPLSLALAQQSGIRVRALTRDPAKAGALAAAGIELVRGDFSDRASLAAALTGVDTLVLITAAGPTAADQAGAAIAAAKAQGVRKIVRLSAIKASPDGPTDNTRQHGRTEATLRASGMKFVALRPSLYMQNLAGQIAGIGPDGKLYAGMGQGKIAMIDTRDVSDALLRAVVDDAFDGQALELSGPASISYADVAATVSSVLGRKIDYVAIPPRDSAESLRAWGADDWMVQLMNDYATAYSRGFGDFVTDAVEKMTGHPPRSFETFAREVLAR